MHEATKGGMGGGNPTQQRALTLRRQGMEGDIPTRKRDPTARSQGEKEGGGGPTHSSVRFLRAARV